MPAVMNVHWSCSATRNPGSPVVIPCSNTATTRVPVSHRTQFFQMAQMLPSGWVKVNDDQFVCPSWVSDKRTID